MSNARLWLLVVAACAALAGWWALAPAAGPAQEVSARRPLFAEAEIPIERVDRVEYAPAEGPAMVFRKERGGWMQVQPYEHPADAAAIRQIIDVAASLESTRTVDAGQAEALGVASPRARLTLGWQGGSSSILLGRRTVAGRAWVRVDGRPQIASVSAALHGLTVEADPRQWRSMALYDPSRGEAERIALKYGGERPVPWVLERTDGRWKVVAPLVTRADDEAVRGYLEALARAEADAFAADQPKDLAAFGLAAPVLGVEIQQGKETSRVEVGTPVAQGAVERFARVNGRPAVLQLGVKALAAIFPPRQFFVDPRGCDAHPADVRGVSFTPRGAAGPAFTLERQRDQWTMRLADGQSGVAAAPAVRRLLEQLAETRAPEVAFQAPPDDTVLGLFTLVGEGGAPLATVRVAREPGSGKWALDNQDGVLRVFPASLDLQLQPDSYR